MGEQKLFMVLIGCKPQGRYTEQHDIFFGVGSTLSELVPQMQAFWPEAKGKFHIDAWREVTQVDGFAIEIKDGAAAEGYGQHLFFINLGGYRPGAFDELHHKMLIVAPDSAKAIARAKQSSFYEAEGFKGAESHIDDKYTLDVDDIYAVKDMLPTLFHKPYHIAVTERSAGPDDRQHIGYLKLSKLTGKGS